MGLNLSVSVSWVYVLKLKKTFQALQLCFDSEDPGKFNVTSAVTGHGNIKAYLHRFKLIDSATCPCRDNNDQTIDHIIYECVLLKTQRDNLRRTVSKRDSWPANKHTLISRHYSAFNKFVNQIAFD
jgi:hypothetical protein